MLNKNANRANRSYTWLFPPRLKFLNVVNPVWSLNTIQRLAQCSQISQLLQLHWRIIRLVTLYPSLVYKAYHLRFPSVLLGITLFIFFVLSLLVFFFFFFLFLIVFLQVCLVNLHYLVRRKYHMVTFIVKLTCDSAISL